MDFKNITSSSSVSFFTNCYEADWETLLCTSRLQQMIEGCRYTFTFRGLIINNVTNPLRVQAAAQAAVNKGIIDAFYFSTDHAHEVLKALNITRSSFKLDLYDGYWYSMGPLTAIYMCPTPWLLYFTCDCMLNQAANGDWITEAISLMKQDEQVASAAPLWDYIAPTVQAQLQTFPANNHWYVVTGFSDQVFLVNTGRFKQPIYNFYHPSCDHFPVYAGNLFERRVNGYLRAEQQLRIVHKNYTYSHEKLLAPHLGNTTSAAKPIKQWAGVWLRKFSRRLRIARWKLTGNTVDY